MFGFVLGIFDGDFRHGSVANGGCRVLCCVDGKGELHLRLYYPCVVDSFSEKKFDPKPEMK